MQDTGCLGLVHWDDPERWYGEGGGRGVQDWEHMYTRGGFMLMYGKTIQYCKVKKKKKDKPLWKMQKAECIQYRIRQTWGYHWISPSAIPLQTLLLCYCLRQSSFFPVLMCKDPTFSPIKDDSLHIHALLHNSKVLHCRLKHWINKNQEQVKQWSTSLTWLSKTHKYFFSFHCKAFLLKIQLTGTMFSHLCPISLTG